MSYERELEVALDAVDRAGRAVMERYDRFEVIPDAPASITTDADREAQEIILGVLHQAFPADALCAEEATPTLAKAPRAGSRLWIVDPIDGTRGFARKNGEFSIMVGFLDRDKIAVGVVGEPARGRLTYASLGAGCHRRDRDGEARCRVTSVSQLQEMTMTQSHSKPGKPQPILDKLKPKRVVECYSAGLKMAIVARGEADLYLNTYEAFHDWDICAGHLLVTEAGGLVTGLKGETLVYATEGFWQRAGMLASNGKVHDAAVDALR